ncbi:M23 family metallopeptidase [Brevibacillus laterosporus]|uniref:M23 family metallopeptidase n=1 Tax=Brevibacillus laterosporus TaxID=1465 RepID=UPI003D1A0F96
MNLNNVLNPTSLSITELMRRVNAFGHSPRVIVELDKFSYMPGLRHKYDVIEVVKEKSFKTTISFGGGDAVGSNAPVMPIEGKGKLSDMVITSRHRSKDPKRPKHKGLDLDLAIGDPVVSVWGGTVMYAAENGGYGNYVKVDHGNGIVTAYAHLSKILVNKGQSIGQGQRIALGGNTGDSRPSAGGDGSHLHFEVWKDGTDVDPEPILNGAIHVNGISGGKPTVTKATEKVSYSTSFNAGWDANKFYDVSLFGGNVFKVGTSIGMKWVLGFQELKDPNGMVSFKFKHSWFKDGYLNFSFVADLASVGDEVVLKMDGNPIYRFTNSPSHPRGVYYPSPISISKGDHVFEFSMRNTKGIKAQQQQFGLIDLKCAEYDVIESQTTTMWDFEDGMSGIQNWTSFNGTSIVNGGDNLWFKDDTSSASGAHGFERLGVVKFPMTVQVRLKVSADTTGSNIYLSDGIKVFTPTFKPDMVEANEGIDGAVTGSYAVDNTRWQDYLLVCKDSDDIKIFHMKDGEWIDTGLQEKSETYSTNRLLFYISGKDTGSLYVDDVKYAFKVGSTEIPNEKHVEKHVPTWYDLGGFVFDETFYIEDEIMSWEVNTHMDMSSATARITLSNHHGLYSPDYTRSSIFPENLRDNPYSYYENGSVRHVISEYTPVRIYAGYGGEIVRVFTGMIKGEIEEDAEQKTITFNCVDRYDLLEQCVLIERMQFPLPEQFQGDKTPRPWIKSSIVQYLANHGGMTGWRYAYEDMYHPDLVIEETYYTDVDNQTQTFMKFDSEGKINEITLGNLKTVGGYKNPFVEGIIFEPGERVSDCIRKVADEINYRTYCNRYGTFIMEHIDFENNMRWEFRDGQNLYSLNSSIDYSRVRNHIQVVGRGGSVEHFFDKDLFIATKGHVRTTQIVIDWINDSNGTTARGAKQVVADKLFFDMKRQARTKNVVVKGNPFIEILDGAWVYDANTSTAGYYIVKGNRLVGDQNGMMNYLELTWEEKIDY